ncbi:DUF4845 domain-containing protein [Thiopseudomonas denitrificans]|uniref:Uncharacterized protein DUF4845 n=1 Tax=Thiopseudomonas denitrificans TaxID=1501432 RepID=A0A4R6U3F4_9GAMM|nr:DUF4845 domain-containing protein [Thiopseudomonas denitrificans]TDQ40196.1 uncharacterized protein DUF4845 [Thiopseudomonas denitrificans]
MNSAKQRGVSLTGWLVILILAGFFASVGFKLFPHYMDNRALDKMITAVDRDAASGVRVHNVGEFYSHINKNMQVNNIRDLNAADIMDVRAEAGEFHVRLKYEVREKILKNIDLVVSFDKEYRVRNQ